MEDGASSNPSCLPFFLPLDVRAFDSCLESNLSSAYQENIHFTVDLGERKRCIVMCDAMRC